MWTISEIAQKLGVNPQTLYYYERIGLIETPERSEGNYRLYTQEDWENLSFITHLKSLGLSLKEIKQLLQLKQEQCLSCAEVAQKLRQKIQQIDTQIANLQALKQELLPLLQQSEIKAQNQWKNNQCIVLSPPVTDR